uniref:Uncharacterized protein n=1 Tax=Nelumbo nucifera TaxID=4432 RepID=A0A822Y2Y4_NELNU|nr:TPA_asm: hypothetical protein HUJ06_026971 [Nelumbo nucifera]DAD25669.1 TPA_asm: hypothetical protein HUJ06_027133 [Nelumbo nucifera]DAD25694.1 TPA_asm: hypothetical protein HUJ06_027158 [Nelumbo nucifera]
MPPSRGADRIGVSLGSHRPTVILKLPCLVEKKRTKVQHITHLRGQGAERPLDLLTAAQDGRRRLGVPCCSDLPYA